MVFGKFTLNSFSRIGTVEGLIIGRTKIEFVFVCFF
jgi:hypothetical protein